MRLKVDPCKLGPGTAAGAVSFSTEYNLILYSDNHYIALQYLSLGNRRFYRYGRSSLYIYIYIGTYLPCIPPDLAHAGSRLK